MEMTAEREEIMAFLKETISLMLQRDGLKEDMEKTGDLYELGVDSVNLIHLVVQLEQQYGIFFEDDELSSDNLATLESICDQIIGKLTRIS